MMKSKFLLSLLLAINLSPALAADTECQYKYNFEYIMAFTNPLAISASLTTTQCLSEPVESLAGMHEAIKKIKVVYKPIFDEKYKMNQPMENKMRNYLNEFLATSTVMISNIESI